jgi:adenylate cyclase
MGPKREYELSEGEDVSLGRHPSQRLQVLDRLCSKEHAVLEWIAPHWYVRDLGSRNGTFLNQAQVVGSQVLSSGDRLLLGNTEIIYLEDAGPVESSSATRVTILPGLRQPQISTILQHRSTSDDYRPAEVISDATELRKDYERLRAAWKLQREVAFEVDLDALLFKVMDSLFEVMRCDRGAILLRDPITGEVETKHVRSREEKLEAEIQISRTLIDQVMEQKVAFQSNDLMGDDRINPTDSIISTGVRSSLSVPLVTRSEDVLGIIHLDCLYSTNAFTERDLELVKGLANQAALAIENSMLIAQREEQQRIRERFSRLMSPALVEELVSGNVEIAPGGQSRRTTVLFTDLREFTSMSQRLKAQDVVQMLNEHFETLVDIVFEHEGTLDKFMGDGLMALWGVPLEVEDAAFKAVSAALAMRNAIQHFNSSRREEGLEELNIGIGIDTGDLIAGYMGSSRTMNYTVIGPPVNQASRLCGAAKATQILISDNTLAAVGSRVQSTTLEPVELKGIGLVAPHNVVGLLDDP